MTKLVLSGLNTVRAGKVRPFCATKSEGRVMGALLHKDKEVTSDAPLSPTDNIGRPRKVSWRLTPGVAVNGTAWALVWTPRDDAGISGCWPV